MNHMDMYIDIETTTSCQLNQIIICISIFFWFHKCTTGLYTTMTLTTLPHPTPGCALKVRSFSASLGSPENTSQLRYDIFVLEPNTSSRCSPSSVASFPNTTMNFIHMSDSFIQDAAYNKIFKTMVASYAHVYLQKINNNKSLICKPKYLSV